ncbi:MAG: NTP transferase domain-containing protein [Lachnospiraceae bacterium]|nr:NTP transferase domain-containing protein [Lachnospiraceae bacterium]
MNKSGCIERNEKDVVQITKEFPHQTPKRAIILAAGFGTRMVPINTKVPKGLLEVHGEPLIERTIKQLHEVNIKEIYIVVGFMKEAYEYLIRQYEVELIENPIYMVKDNLHSLKCVLEYLSDSYIIPSDIWCGRNPYHFQESHSWYRTNGAAVSGSVVRINQETGSDSGYDFADGNVMTGICYLMEREAEKVRKRVVELCKDIRYDAACWESALYQDGKMILEADVFCPADMVEINTYEQLRGLDRASRHLKTKAIEVICKTLGVSVDDITDITALTKGMTNRSFCFICNGKKYIMRIPGEGTEQLINRRQEAAVYETIGGKGICDNIIYINSENGYKITEFLEDARVCDAMDENDIEKCMQRLRVFHEMKLEVDHEFAIFDQIEFYETLWGDRASAYMDYQETKKQVFSLKEYIDAHVNERVLTHMDAVPDNFLFTKRSGEEEILLIDWEYAGMQDPHVDVAMFCIYSFYDRKWVDRLIAAYFQGKCSDENRIKIYCYIAACGLLWSNWCEYKKICGIDFGEYALWQYRYAKDYYKIVQDELWKLEEKKSSQR